MTIHGRVLGVPTAERLLVDMDSLPRNDNPFNSVQRLQAIVSKCGNNQDNSTWAMEHIRHMVCAPPCQVSENCEIITGSVAQQRHVDVILLRKDALGNCCHKLP
ncbi:MAG: hypothetical protein ACKPKO_63150, partial [Candidatus Fonsibacter sp.]